MSAALKVGLIILAFSLLMGLIALLPSTDQYPLPPAFATSVAVVFAYVFAWVGVFWFISIWWWIALLTIGLELSIWIAKKVIQIFSWLARLFA